MRRIDPATILKVTTERDNALYALDTSVREQVVPANYAYLVTSIMSDCNARYLVWSCGYFDIGRPYAVKTGTQQGLAKDRQGRDITLYNWQVGFTPDIAVGVWIGNQDNTPVNSANFETANAANSVWRRVTQAAVRGLPARPFQEPPGIERARTLVGRPGSFNCSSTYDEIWAAGDVKSPQEQCRVINSQRPSNAPSGIPVSPSPSPNRPQVETQQDRPDNNAQVGAAPPGGQTPVQPGASQPVPATGAPPAQNPAPAATGPPPGQPVQPVAPPAGTQPVTAPTPTTLVASGQQPAPNAVAPR
jgi:membrane peptidoglycan carboxypeptidase